MYKCVSCVWFEIQTITAPALTDATTWVGTGGEGRSKGIKKGLVLAREKRRGSYMEEERGGREGEDRLIIINTN